MDYFSISFQMVLFWIVHFLFRIYSMLRKDEVIYIEYLSIFYLKKIELYFTCKILMILLFSVATDQKAMKEI